MKDDQIKKFMQLYTKHFHEELCKTEALKKALKLLRLVEILYLPCLVIDHQICAKL